MNISLLINMKMPTIFDIFIFISRKMFMRSAELSTKQVYSLRTRTNGKEIHVAKMDLLNQLIPDLR